MRGIIIISALRVTRACHCRL